MIPPDATLDPASKAWFAKTGVPADPPTIPPHKFSFHYLDSPLPAGQLEDGASINSGIYEFTVKEAVLGVFDQPFYDHNEFCWSFSTSAQIDVVAALRIGETLDIEFDRELAAADHVTKYHFPSGVRDDGYGKYGFHVQVDGLTGRSFRLVSAYEPKSRRTGSRLPFFMGFRVFGTPKDAPDIPVWRDLLGHGVREALFHRWQHALLFAAFALESYIDGILQDRLKNAGLGERYAEHVLRVAERRYELHALSELTGRLPENEVNRQCEHLNRKIFTPRNRLAHGSLRGREITEDVAADAIRAVVRFIWDTGKTQRHFLLSEMPTHSIAGMVDDELRRACTEDKGQ